MAELEIHHEEGHHSDPLGQKVGILAAVLAVCLAIVSITSHRTHTEAIIEKSSANDAWSHYQSTREKFHSLELGETLISVLGGKGESAQKALSSYAAQKADYAKRGQTIQAEAEKDDRAAGAAERRALRYDLGEGMLEIALVLSSLYFISRRKMFPVIGVVAGLAGMAVAVTGMLS